VRSSAKKKASSVTKAVAAKKASPKSAKKSATKKKTSKTAAKRVAATSVRKRTPAKPKTKSKPTAAKKPAVKKLATKTPAVKKSAAKKSAAKKPAVKKPSSKPVAPTKSLENKLSGSVTSAKPLKKATSIPPKDFDKFRAMLLTIRRRLIGDVNMMSEEALGGSDGAADNHAPIHPAEVGTHSFEQEFTLNLLSSDGDRIERIEAALEKIHEGTYGSCDECGGRIPKARLEVIPDTPFCVKCASRLEG
jgi:DnaK suppressor protein